MRTMAREVLRHPSRLYDWWLDTPWKRPRNWWTLLFYPGRGWLRWGWNTAWEMTPILEDGSGPLEPFGVAPPLRRIWERVRYPLIAFVTLGVYFEWDWDSDLDRMVRRRLAWLPPSRWWDPAEFRDVWSWAQDPGWPYDYLT